MQRGHRPLAKPAALSRRRDVNANSGRGIRIHIAWLANRPNCLHDPAMPSRVLPKVAIPKNKIRIQEQRLRFVKNCSGHGLEAGFFRGRFDPSRASSGVTRRRIRPGFGGGNDPAGVPAGRGPAGGCQVSSPGHSAQAGGKDSRDSHIQSIDRRSWHGGRLVLVPFLESTISGQAARCCPHRGARYHQYESVAGCGSRGCTLKQTGGEVERGRSIPCCALCHERGLRTFRIAPALHNGRL